MLLELFILTAFPGAMILAASTDLFTMTIPNRISLFLVVSFFLLGPFAGLDFADMGWHALAGMLTLAIGFVLFTRGWIGGGDAKFFAATALWLGFGPLFTYTIYAALVGGVLTVLMLAWNRLPLPPLLAKQAWLVRLHGLRQGVPYGVALAAAGLLVFPQTSWFTNLVS